MANLSKLMDINPSLLQKCLEKFESYKISSLNKSNQLQEKWKAIENKKLND